MFTPWYYLFLWAALIMLYFYPLVLSILQLFFSENLCGIVLYALSLCSSLITTIYIYICEPILNSMILQTLAFLCRSSLWSLFVVQVSMFITELELVDHFVVCESSNLIVNGWYIRCQCKHTVEMTIDVVLIRPIFYWFRVQIPL